MSREDHIFPNATKKSSFVCCLFSCRPLGSDLIIYFSRQMWDLLQLCSDMFGGGRDYFYWACERHQYITAIKHVFAVIFLLVELNTKQKAGRFIEAFFLSRRWASVALAYFSVRHNVCARLTFAGCFLADSSRWTDVALIDSEEARSVWSWELAFVTGSCLMWGWCVHIVKPNRVFRERKMWTEGSGGFSAGLGSRLHVFSGKSNEMLMWLRLKVCPEPFHWELTMP